MIKVEMQGFLQARDTARCQLNIYDCVALGNDKQGHNHPYFPVDIGVVDWLEIPVYKGPPAGTCTMFYIERAICPEHQTLDALGRVLPVRVAPQSWVNDRIPSTTPGAEPPRDAKDSGSARPHSTHPETSSTNRP